MVAKKKNIKEMREELSMLGSVKAIFSPRNFGREIATIIFSHFVFYNYISLYYYMLFKILCQ